MNRMLEQLENKGYMGEEEKSLVKGLKDDIEELYIASDAETWLLFCLFTRETGWRPRRHCTIQTKRFKAWLLEEVEYVPAV